MSLNDVFQSAADTIFKIFDSLTKPGYYVVREGTGWGEEDEEPDPAHSMKVIVNGLTQEQVRNTKFFTQIQPLDTIIMVKGADIRTNDIVVKNSDVFKVVFGSDTKAFDIIDHETDPAEAVYLMLLRENHSV